MFQNTFFLAEAAPMGFDGIFLMLAIIVIFYFFMIRPQQKRQKTLKKQREAMTKGDSVVTAGGIYGRIVEVREDSFLIEIDKNVKIRIDKSSVYPNAAEAAVDAAQNGNAK